MLAHPQSIPAARIPVTPLPPPTATAIPIPVGSHPPSHPSFQPHAQPAVRYLPAAPAAVLAPAPAASMHGPGIAESAGLAHDAGNLLGALGLYCDLLRAPGVLRPEHLHYATELSLISSRSSELIRRLLDSEPAGCYSIAPTPLEQAELNRESPPAAHGALEFQSTGQSTGVSRRDATLPAVSRSGLTPASVLRNLSPVLGRIAAGSAHVSVSAPATLPAVDLLVEALERITVNLVRNAAEAIRTQRLYPQPPTLRPEPASPAAQPAGQIRVALALVAGRLQLTVEDNGPGVPPAVAAAFLQPRPMPANSSRGFGHRIVHELVNASGGQLSIRVRPGQGTVFCIKWPIPRVASERFDATDVPALPTSSSLTLQGEPSAC
jgi:signal transduction histidine kinase